MDKKEKDKIIKSLEEGFRSKKLLDVYEGPSEPAIADFIEEVIDKTVGEEKKDLCNAQLKEIEVSRNEERGRTLTEVMTLLDNRREMGLSEMWVVNEIVKRLKKLNLTKLK